MAVNKENRSAATPTLKEFQDLNLSKEEIYTCLRKYLLDSKTLRKLTKPVLKGARISENGTVVRKCYRCLERFEVTTEGEYLVNENCYYHPDKVFLCTGSNYLFKCCKRHASSIGCKVHPLHICGDPLLSQEIKSVGDKNRVHQLRGVYALDCEMVYTRIGLEVAKIALVNEEGLPIYTSFVQPEYEILDYCSRYSGIEANDLLDVTTTLHDVQTILCSLLHSECILIGHGLGGDLRCLRLNHQKIIDTSVVFSRSKGLPKLRELAYEKLKRVIQNDIGGHDCIEDARTCMALMLNKIKEDRGQ